MADEKASVHAEVTPGATTSFLVIDGVTPANKRVDYDTLAATLGHVPQFEVATGNTLALTKATHQGATIILGGASATVSFNATTQGDGFAVKIINDTGGDWTVPTFTGGTNRYDFSGHTKIVGGGSGALEVFTRGGTRYVHVSGATI